MNLKGQAYFQMILQIHAAVGVICLIFAINSQGMFFVYANVKRPFKRSFVQ